MARSSLPVCRACAIPAAISLAAGCGFHAPGGPDGAPLPDDAAPASPCLGRWRDDTVTLGAPTPIAELASPDVDRDPYLTPDELTIYFSTTRNATSSGMADVYVAKRTSLSAPFGGPQRVDEICSAEYDSRFSMSASELIGVVASSRAGTEGNSDLWIAARTSKAAPFGAFQSTMGLPNVNSSDHELDPEVSADGLRIYLAVGLPQRIMVSQRSSLGSTFGSVQQVQGVTANVGGDADPSLSPDERIIAFASSRSSSDGDLYYATRADKDAAFGTPIRVPTVNANGANDGDPTLSADGCRLYFASDRSGNWELYVAAVTPL